MSGEARVLPTFEDGDIIVAKRSSSTMRGRKRHRADRAWRNLCSGAGEGIRTLDPNLGKVVLYP
jgi:hypothetical protein